MRQARSRSAGYAFPRKRMRRPAWKPVGAALAILACLAIAWWALGRANATAVSGAIPPAVASATRDADESADPDDDAADPPPRIERRTRPPSRRPTDHRAAPEEDAEHPDPNAAPPNQQAYALLLHGADPCEPIQQPKLGPEYESVTAEEVTVAWPPTVSVEEPTLLAHVVAGLLDEAALLTDTDRRPRLTVLVHATAEDLRDATGAPSWTRAFYDGAVHVVSTPSREFGVRFESLRHEVMHAQIHSGVGCAPAWLHEGAAMYFSHRAPEVDWKRIVRDGATLPFEVLSAPSVVGSAAERSKEDVDVAYGESLAMLLYAMEQGRSLDVLVQPLRDARPELARAKASGLWRATEPNLTPRDLRAWLARRIFGASSVSGLDDAIRASAVCCTGYGRAATFACRVVAPRPAEPQWFNDAGDLCSTGWQ
jgi:hypothetical protein